MHPAIATVARYVLVEARRSGLPWLAAACVLAVLALAGFLSQVAITEAAALQASAGAALLRACAVFLIAAHVVASVVREANDKGLELALALPISRPAWYLGKLLGFACAGALLATLFALPLLVWAKPADLAAWWLSLAVETALVAAAALFFASALGADRCRRSPQPPACTCLRARCRRSRRSPAARSRVTAPRAQAARWIVDALALLLPRLDAVTRGDWLLYGAPPAGELAPLLRGTGDLRRCCSPRQDCSTSAGATCERILRASARQERPLSAVPRWVLLAARAPRSQRSSAGNRTQRAAAPRATDLPPAPSAAALRLASLRGNRGARAPRHGLAAGLRFARRQRDSVPAASTTGA